MITITQELAQLQAEFEGLISSWNGLTLVKRRRAWGSYLDAIDEGGDGWHRFSRVLLNAYCEGWCPLAGVRRDSEGALVPALLQAA